jgi:cbb3-type cytochrome oxidase subunit 3
MSLNEALQRASENAQQKHQKEVRDKLIQHVADTYSYASVYDNAIIVGGFAAFFALWGGTSGDIARFPRLVTVSLMGLALLLYITWHMLQMLARQKFEHERAGAFALMNDPQAFNERYIDIDQRQAIAFQRILRLWPFIFVPSVVFGFAGGGLLAYSALAAAFSWPQLTGHW